MLLEKNIKKIVFLVFTLVVCLAPSTSSYAYLVTPSGYSFSRSPDYGWIDGGQYTYDDTNKTKLTDGIKGQDNWTQDYHDWVGWWGISYQGDYDKDGSVSKGDYTDNPITITFNFQQNFKLASISLWTNQDAINNFNVIYPGSISISKSNSELVTLTSSFDRGRSGNDNGYNNGRLHEISFDLGNLDVQSGDEISVMFSNWNIFTQLQSTNDGNWAYDSILWNNNAGSSYNGMFWIFLSEVAFESSNPVPVPGTFILFGSGLIPLLGVSRRRVRS